MVQNLLILSVGRICNLEVIITKAPLNIGVVRRSVGKRGGEGLFTAVPRHGDEAR